jgi:hypothetical protein
MPQVQSFLTTSFRAQQWDGVHLPTHEYRMAVYGPDMLLGPEIEAYTPEGESAGRGYPPGGAPLTNRRVSVVNDVVILEWDPFVIPVATLSGVAGLIYNASLPGMPSVAVIAFEEPTSSTNGPFTVPLEGALQWASA